MHGPTNTFQNEAQAKQQRDLFPVLVSCGSFHQSPRKIQSKEGFYRVKRKKHKNNIDKCFLQPH